MPCQPCEERKARLKALANEGAPLPKRDYAFYLVVGVAVGAVAYIVMSKRRSKDAR